MVYFITKGVFSEQRRSVQLLTQLSHSFTRGGERRVRKRGFFVRGYQVQDFNRGGGGNMLTNIERFNIKIT